ncbi:hypothetical protein L3Q82_012085 [Scortum barcoo]|uniref:Uncharacterized protein n=1 Tax=Scortum barcoo TaxID=214431 RepID=A0ACB8W640_9TELE|nr:hypothetical protein L3Q82_012085 [Scortum barcoo]
MDPWMETSPTIPPLHSEHFKPCHEKDLAYCLNGGECFVIETLSGPHKHCKCREGYQGIRCDQFLPKTDSILSDPSKFPFNSEHNKLTPALWRYFKAILGRNYVKAQAKVEVDEAFWRKIRMADCLSGSCEMSVSELTTSIQKSKEVYKRQVLSITSIAMAISLLGTLCMALYCRNKRRREKLQAHLKESRSLKNYTANSLDAKMRAPNTNLQMHEYCKRPSQARQGNVCESSFAHCNISATPSSSTRGTAKHHRSGSLSHSPDQRTRAAHWSAPRRTPPIPRGRLNPIGGSKYSGPAYQHLQEVDSTEKETEAQRGCHMQGADQRDDPRRDAFLHMRTPIAMETASSSPWSGRVEVRSGLCAQADDPNPATRSLRRPGRRHSQSPPPPFRSCSIPIIPSVQYHHDNEVSCMQTSVTPATTAMSATCGATPCKEGRREKAVHAALSSSSCASAIDQQQDKVALLLEEAQEQLRALALAHRKQEEGGTGSGGGVSTTTPMEARETVCFLNLNGGSAGALSCNGPTQTQLLSPSLSHRDLGQTTQ